MDDIFRYINIYVYTVVVISLHSLEEVMLFCLFCPFFRNNDNTKTLLSLTVSSWVKSFMHSSVFPF